MKKLLLFIFLSLSVYAQKPYMLIVVQEGCPACIEVKQMIRNDKSLRDTIKDYTSLQVMSKSEAASVGFNVAMTPSFYFFAKEKRQLLAPVIEGAPTSSEGLVSYIKEVHTKYNASLKQNSL